MPIKQERMISLINASVNLLNAYNRIYLIAKESHSIRNSEISGALDDLAKVNIHHPAIDQIIQAHDKLVEAIEQGMPSPVDISIIAQERGHFNARRKANDRTREVMQNMRKRRKEKEEEEEFEEEAFDILSDQTSTTDINLDELEAKVRQFKTAYPFKDITARTIMECAASLGAKSLDLQLELLQKLVDQNKIKEGEFGVYELVEPRTLGT
jgi:tRNA U38,U39,U40 pseudouridine synthase TruA